MSEIKKPPIKLSELDDDQLIELIHNHDCDVFHEDHTICDLLRYTADQLPRNEDGTRDWSGILSEVQCLMSEEAKE